jgi:hypothetical protein
MEACAFRPRRLKKVVTQKPSAPVMKRSKARLSETSQAGTQNHVPARPNPSQHTPQTNHESKAAPKRARLIRRTTPDVNWNGWGGWVSLTPLPPPPPSPRRRGSRVWITGRAQRSGSLPAKAGTARGRRRGSGTGAGLARLTASRSPSPCGGGLNKKQNGPGLCRGRLLVSNEPV